MDIADPETALARLYEFLHLQEQADPYSDSIAPRDLTAAINHLRPLVEEISRALGEPHVGNLSGFPYTAIGATNRLIGILERQADYRQILGPVGPTLAASGLHRWVWNAAASLWDDGYFGQAVEDAYKKVERETQQRVGRLNLYGKDLYAQAFSLDDPKPDMPRLRFPHLDKTSQAQSWKSAHQGAMHLGMGCAQGIRNRQAHPSPDITEQEALEQLAALSVLARWVDECKPVGVDADAAGE